MRDEVTWPARAACPDRGLSKADKALRDIMKRALAATMRAAQSGSSGTARPWSRPSNTALVIASELNRSRTWSTTVRPS